MWVRGLKHEFAYNSQYYALSHPVWVRGLKLIFCTLVFSQLLSHPVWVRGLKPLILLSCHLFGPVAPRVGAWIETFFFNFQTAEVLVAPRVGAWIETPYI